MARRGRSRSRGASRARYRATNDRHPVQPIPKGKKVVSCFLLGVVLGVVLGVAFAVVCRCLGLGSFRIAVGALKPVGLWLLHVTVRLLAALWKVLVSILVKAGALQVKVLELGFIGTAAILATLKTVGLWFLHDSVRRLVPCLLEVGALLVEVLNWRTTAIAVILGLAAVPCVGYMLYLRATPFFNTTAEDDEYDHGRANHHNYEKRKNKQRDAPKPGKSWRRDQSKRENPRKHPNRREDIEKAREATLSNAFEAWLDEIHVLMGDRARIRNLPPRAPPAASCSSDFCKQRKAEKNVTFCAHSIQQLVDAYVSTKRLTPEQRRQMLRKQVIMWHPDRFAACSADVRPRIQEVAMELMKVMRQVQDGDVCEVRS